jgi:3-methyl-2-oxobutanoate hydroxymethyltransferase
MQTQPITVPLLAQKKPRGEKITILTAYDYPTALLVDQSGVDIVFVGDSVGREELGYDSELRVTMDDMVRHIRAVRRGTKRALLLADMPFLSFQVNPDEAVRNAGRLVQEGANAVKIEGGAADAAAIRRIVDAGIPVMGHIGFRPQSVNVTGVGKQGKDEESARRLFEDARAMQNAGAFSVLLELIPAELAGRLTAELDVPTIGIGSGPRCDGQVLVWSDLVGLRPDRPPFKHVKQYANIGEEILRAFRAYKEDVEQGRFPT